jgi:isopenicillin-N epimerase
MLAQLENAQQVLGRFINTSADDLVFVPNATFGLIIIARSLHLEPEDEILASNHEYGAYQNTWEFICQKTGAVLIRRPISMQLG